MDDEQLARELSTGRGQAPDASHGPHLDADEIAAFSEGRLTAAERTPVAAHLAACADCRDLVADLAGELEPAPAPAATTVGRSPRSLPLWATAAAVLLIIVGAVSLRMSWLGGRPVEPEITLAALEGAARDLRTEHGEAFADFAPYSRAALAQMDAGTDRGLLTIHTPRGALLTGTLSVSWSRAAAPRFRVLVRDDEGGVVHETITDGPGPVAIMDPVLRRGAVYVVKVTALDSAQKHEATSSVRVLTQAEAEAYGEAVAAIRAGAPEGLRPLLIAHLALRKELFEEARGALQPVGTDDPELVRATRAAIARLQGR